MTKKLPIEEKERRRLEREKTKRVDEYILLTGRARGVLKKDLKGKKRMLLAGAQLSCQLTNTKHDQQRGVEYRGGRLIGRTWIPPTKYYSHFLSVNRHSKCMCHANTPMSDGNYLHIEIGGDTDKELLYNLVTAYVDWF